ncbi:DUF2357 domain-containing protein [Caenispirillum bisanense]|uniref:DUF2357 domain-containing protein n=1 Tax=Caenispirillum bisanense TaxID=414052 RepID=A0A286GDC9_9PROT|nr:DUF2357 domain-containing protein [Caenispirillum bisanense]SOD93246.1 protein of unknown function [Caenispirillum bisanense]
MARTETVIPLDLPWSLLEDVAPAGPDDDGVELPASGAPAVASSHALRLRLAGQRQQPHREVPDIQWGPRRIDLWTLPMPAQAGDHTRQLELLHDRGQHPPVKLSITGCLGQWSPERLGDPLAQRILERDNMLGALIDRIDRLTNIERREMLMQGNLRGRVRSTWRHAAEAFCADLDVEEARMALIVRHAQDLHRLVADLGRHPRQVLTRNRSMQSVHRIQEMDPACLAWYVRQPGRTPAEKAGSRQALLAVVREETVDTPENRVLKDFLIRTTEAADSYLGANRNLAGSVRYGDVSRYGRTCATLLRQPEFQRIRSLVGTAQANYVLTQDPRYRRIWSAYQQLLNRLRQQDDSWGWQGRLWGDGVTLALGTALLRAQGLETLAVPSLYVRKEQDRGRWLEPAGCVGVFAGRDSVHMLHEAEAPGAPPDLHDRYAVLWPRLVMRNQPLGSAGHDEDVLIWTVLGAGIEARPLTELTARAAAALARWQDDRRRYYNDRRRVRGIVVVPPERLDQPHPETVAEGAVLGLGLPLDGPGFRAGLDSLAAMATRGEAA